MSDLEFYLWIAFFVSGIVALPFMFHHRKIILRRIRLAYIQTKATTFIKRREQMCMREEKIDPYKQNFDR